MARIINKRRTNTKFSTLHQRMIEDEDFLNNQSNTLHPRTKAEFLDPNFGRTRFKTWAPALLFKAIKARLNDLKPYISTPVVNNALVRAANQEQEYFLNGCLKEVDLRNKDLGTNSLITQISFQAIMRGFICGRSMMVRYQSADEPDYPPYARPEIQIWDSKDTIWSMDGRGLEWIATRRSVPAGRIKKMVRGDSDFSDDDTIEIWEFLDRKYYAVLYASSTGDANETDVGNARDTRTMYLQAPARHGLVDGQGRPRTPGFVVQVGSGFSNPTNDSISKEESYRQLGETIFSLGYKEQVQQANHIYDGWIEQIDDRRRTQKIYQSLKHRPDVAEGLDEGASTINISPDENVTPLNIPVDRSAGQTELLSLVLRGLEQGTAIDIPPDSTASGYAITLLQQTTNSRILPYQEAIASAYHQALRSLRDHFKTGYFGNIELFGQSSIDGSKFEREINHQLVKVASSFEVEMIEPNRLVDPTRAHAGSQLNQAGLLSKRRFMEKWLNVNDPDAEMDRINIEQMEQVHPLIRPAVIAGAYAKIGEQSKAEMLLRDIERTFNLIEETSYVERLQRLITIPYLLAGLQQANPEGAFVALELAQRLGIGGVGAPNGKPQSLALDAETLAALTSGQLFAQQPADQPAGDSSTPPELTNRIDRGTQAESARNRDNAQSGRPRV